MHRARSGQRQRDMRHDGPAIDLPRSERADDVADALQRHVFKADALGLGHLRAHVVKRRARLRHRIAPPVKRGGRRHPVLERRVRDQVFLPGDARFLLQRAADHPDRTAIGQRDQRAGHRGDAVIHIARGDRHRHRLRGIEEPQFDVEPGIGEIAPFQRDIAAGMAGQPQRAHHHRRVGERRAGQPAGRGGGPAHGRQGLASVHLHPKSSLVGDAGGGLCRPPCAPGPHPRSANDMGMGCSAWGGGCQGLARRTGPRFRPTSPRRRAIRCPRRRPPRRRRGKARHRPHPRRFPAGPSAPARRASGQAPRAVFPRR
jgi:hypothetical protein